MHNNLELEQMQRMSIDEIVGLYRQGYRLGEFYPNMDKILPYSPRKEYQFMNPASCPAKVAKGSTKNVEVKVTSPGTPPYTFKLQRNGAEIYNYTGEPTETSKIWPHKFDEALGTYTYKGFVIDSCPGEPKPSNIDSCSITIQKEAPPIGIGPGIILLGVLTVLGIATMK